MGKEDWLHGKCICVMQGTGRRLNIKKWLGALPINEHSAIDVGQALNLPCLMDY